MNKDTYRGWSIDYDPKPIPVRDFDWTATHPDYDASWEGEIADQRYGGLLGAGAPAQENAARQRRQ